MESPFGPARIAGMRVEGEAVLIERGRHTITSAYCEEMNRVTDIESAQAYCLEVLGGARMVFRCSDNACRERYYPEIIGVNYHVPPEEQESLVQAIHFRWKSADPHLMSCIWVADYIARAERRQSKVVSTNPNRNIELDAVGDIVDEFIVEPRDRIQETESNDDCGADVNQRAARNLERRRAALSDGTVSSSFIERIARCFEALSREDLVEEAQLEINGVRKPYLHWFRGVSKFRTDVGDAIFIGNVRTVRRLDKGYWLRFYDEIPINGESREGYVWIPFNLLEEFRFRGSLRATLDKIANDGNTYYGKCYFYGSFDVDAKGRARARFGSLSHIFLALRPRGGALRTDD